MDKKIKIKKAFQMKRYLFLLLSFLILSLTGCDYIENSDTINTVSVTVNLSDLPAIPDSMTFVTWFDSDNQPAVMFFAKDSDADGNLYFTAQKRLGTLIDAQILSVTIERESALNDSGFAPSGRLVLSGRVKNGNCSLNIGETINQFAETSGLFTLSTPTNGAASDELSGLWFIDSLASGAPVAGLNLPALYNGWRYEGWVEINGTLVSTGRFTKPEGADLFSAYSSTSAGYLFPGEDFLQNAPVGLTFPTDLSGQKVFISLERNDGATNGVSPFIIILSATIVNPAQNGITYEMQKTNNLIPLGSAVIKADLLE